MLMPSSAKTGACARAGRQQADSSRQRTANSLATSRMIHLRKSDAGRELQPRRVDAVEQPAQGRGVHEPGRLRRLAMPARGDDAIQNVEVGRRHDQLEEKAIELGFRQWIGPLQLDGVL